MAGLVPIPDIEEIIGAERHVTFHLARAESDEQKIYVLHSHWCLVVNDDLRDCRYAQAQDREINVDEWVEDVPVHVTIFEGRLVPKKDSEWEGDNVTTTTRYDPFALTGMKVSDITRLWVPGSRSQPWTWEQELGDIKSRVACHGLPAHESCEIPGHYYAQLKWHMHREGKFWDAATILLGSDGRVWDGHHRICAAIELGWSRLQVERA